VHYKPLYEAIGERDNRHRKPVSLGATPAAGPPSAASSRSTPTQLHIREGERTRGEFRDYGRRTS
jgi:hypothetical protein